MAGNNSLAIAKPRRFRVEPVLLFSGVALGTFVVSMAVWVLVPALMFGWTPLVISSGSMQPHIRVGDVVLIDTRDEAPETGSVVAFQSEGQLTVHRVVETHSDGSMTTRGDANRRNDSTPVTQDALLGRARILVPYVGLLRVVGWSWMAVVAILALSAVGLWTKRPSWATAAGLMALGAIATAVASATFLVATSNGGNNMTALDVAPPTSLAASCGGVGAGNITVQLSWLPSPTAGLTGYRVLHDDAAAGTNFTEVGTVGPAITAFSHQIPTALVSLGLHTYAIQTMHGAWSSENSATDAVNITRVVLVYFCSEA